MPAQHRVNGHYKRRHSLNKFREWQPMLTSAWVCHFGVSSALILWGSNHYDEDRKYIPIDTKTIQGSCDKAYVNVFASSSSDIGSIVCCTEEITDGICGSTPSFLLLARRLTRLPEAWLLPLFPVLIRGVVQFARSHQQIGSITVNGKRRFYLYIGLIQIRVWVLYLLFDKVEDLVVQSAGDTCWYDRFRHNYQAPCQGTATDYSDHIVLFFAQILPIAFTEVLFSFVAPYWKNHSFLVPAILSTGLLYLYVITLFAVYKTVAHFHTLFEVVVGYCISLLIQIPLFLVLSTSLMVPVRDYFFVLEYND